MLGKFLVAWIATIDALRDRVADRVRPQHRHRSDSRDCIVYRLAGSNRVRGTAGATATFRERYQLDCYANTQADADALGQLFLDNLDGYSGAAGGVQVLNVQVADSIDDEDPEADGLPAKPRRVLTLAIWYRQA